MKGSNSLHLCQAALAEAVEYYLNKEVFTEGAAHEVTGVQKDREAQGGGSTLHVVVGLKPKESAE